MMTVLATAMLRKLWPKDAILDEEIKRQSTKRQGVDLETFCFESHETFNALQLNAYFKNEEFDPFVSSYQKHFFESRPAITPKGLQKVIDLIAVS